jgi:hypothetical protein
MPRCLSRGAAAGICRPDMLSEYVYAMIQQQLRFEMCVGNCMRSFGSRSGAWLDYTRFSAMLLTTASPFKPLIPFSPIGDPPQVGQLQGQRLQALLRGGCGAARGLARLAHSPVRTLQQHRTSTVGNAAARLNQRHCTAGRIPVWCARARPPRTQPCAPSAAVPPQWYQQTARRCQTQCPLQLALPRHARSADSCWHTLLEVCMPSRHRREACLDVQQRERPGGDEAL